MLEYAGQCVSAVRYDTRNKLRLGCFTSAIWRTPVHMVEDTHCDVRALYPQPRRWVVFAVNDTAHAGVRAGGYLAHDIV